MLTINYRPYINFFLPSIAYSIYILNPMSTSYQIGVVLFNNSIRVLWVNNSTFYFTHLSVIYFFLYQSDYLFLVCFLFFGKSIVAHFFIWFWIDFIGGYSFSLVNGVLFSISFNKVCLIGVLKPVIIKYYGLDEGFYIYSFSITILMYD